MVEHDPTELAALLDALAQNAALACNAEDASIILAEGETIRVAAHFGTLPNFPGTVALDRTSSLGAAILNRETIHVEDLLAADRIPTQLSLHQFSRAHGFRTMLVAPL